jgi:hypothetical protein
MPSDFERAYLPTDDPCAQSGFYGSAERWEAARRTIGEAIDGSGTFLDVGCANGLLMESVVARSDYEIEPYGVDLAPGLVDLARARLPTWADRIWVGDAATWTLRFTSTSYTCGSRSACSTGSAGSGAA